MESGIVNRQLTERFRDEFILNNLIELNEQRLTGTFCDLTIRCKDDQELKVHKAILCAASGYFRDMFTSNMMESSADSIQLNIITGVILEEILTFVYLGELKVTVLEKIEKIAEHAYYFQLTKLVEICGAFLEESINDSNCLKYWRLAKNCGLEKFANASLNHILRGDSGQLYSLLLKDFTLEEMKTLLMDDRLSGSEEAIFELALKWAKYNSNNENEFLPFFSQVVDFIRFPLMKMPYFLGRVLSNEDFLEDKELLKKISESGKYFANSDSGGTLTFPKCAIPRIGSRTEEFLAIHGDEVFKVFSAGELQAMRSNCTREGFGYTKFGSNLLLLCGGQQQYLGSMLPFASSNEPSHAPSPACEYFSPNTKEWKHFPDMSHSRSNHGCATIGNKIYVCGGMQTSKTIDIFDLDRGEWCTGPQMIVNRSQFGLTTLNQSLYAIGGDGRFSVEMMDPRTPDGWIILHQESTSFQHMWRCASIGSLIYCFNVDRQYIYDTRNNKKEIFSCPPLTKRKSYLRAFDVCELNGEIGVLQVEDDSFQFYECHVHEQITKDMRISRRKSWNYIALIALHY